MAVFIVCVATVTVVIVGIKIFHKRDVLED